MDQSWHMVQYVSASKVRSGQVDCRHNVEEILGFNFVEK